MKKKYSEGGSTGTSPLTPQELHPRKFMTAPEPGGVKKGGKITKRKGGKK